MTEDKELVINFFKSKTIVACHSPKKQQGKKPDFELYSNNQLFGYCELKSIVDYEFYGERRDPTYNKIQNKIHEATKQFNSVNPAHNLPNILFFINHCSKVSYQDLWFVLSGQTTPPNQPSDPLDLRYLKRLIKRNDLEIIDFIIWGNTDEKATSFVINSDSKFHSNLKTTISSKAYEKTNINNYT